MFDIGFWEIFLIGILALLVIGPERLPAAARSAGYWIGRARRYVEGVKNEVESEFDMSEFKRLLHNQEVQITELQHKLNNKVDGETLSTSADSTVPEYDFQDDPPDEQDDVSKSDLAAGADTDATVDETLEAKAKQDKPSA